MKIADLKQNEVIHCKTKEEAVRICGMMHAAGLRPGSFFTDNWDVHEENTCYDLRSDEAGHVALYVQDNYTIHPSELFREDSSDEITKDGLRARLFKEELLFEDGVRFFKSRKDWNISIQVSFFLNGNILVQALQNSDSVDVFGCKTLTDIDHLIRLLGV